MKACFLGLLLFLISPFVVAKKTTFVSESEEAMESRIISYLEVNSSAFIERANIEGITIAPCGYATSGLTIFVCPRYRHDLMSSSNSVIVYGVLEQTYAFIIEQLFPKESRILVIENKHRTLSTYLDSKFSKVKSVSSGSVRDVFKHTDSANKYDAVVLGLGHGLLDEELYSLLSFLKRERYLTISANPLDLKYGAAMVVAPLPDEILTSMVKILGYYKQTGYLISTSPICSGTIRVNEEALRSVNFTLDISDITAIENIVFRACKAV